MILVRFYNAAPHIEVFPDLPPSVPLSPFGRCRRFGGTATFCHESRENAGVLLRIDIYVVLPPSYSLYYELSVSTNFSTGVKVAPSFCVICICVTELNCNFILIILIHFFQAFSLFLGHSTAGGTPARRRSGAATRPLPTTTPRRTTWPSTWTRATTFRGRSKRMKRGARAALRPATAPGKANPGKEATPGKTRRLPRLPCQARRRRRRRMRLQRRPPRRGILCRAETRATGGR